MWKGRLELNVALMKELEGPRGHSERFTFHMPNRNTQAPHRATSVGLLPIPCKQHFTLMCHSTDSDAYTSQLCLHATCIATPLSMALFLSIDV
jgi:hypothetical protein